MPVTVRGTDILFNDGSTQSTSAVPSSITAIGTVLFAANYTTTDFQIGSTIAGSSLLYSTSYFTSALNPQTALLEKSTFYYVQITSTGLITGDRSGNTGIFQPNNTLFLTGTWRILNVVLARRVTYDTTYNYTTISIFGCLVQRIA